MTSHGSGGARASTSAMRLFLLACACLLAAFLTPPLHAQTEDNAPEGGVKTDKDLEIYRSLLAAKRQEQIQTVESVRTAESFEKQYKTVAFVMEAIFPLLDKSLAEVKAAGYEAGSPFPAEQKMKEVVGKVYENVAYFGDFLLRLPDITKQLYGQHPEWHRTFQAAMTFCLKSREVFSGPLAAQLHMMAQEIGLIPEEPNYHNPFRMDPKSTDDITTRAKRARARGANSSPKRGPKLRGVRHSEL